jgi:hypothetical protein
VRGWLVYSLIVAMITVAGLVWRFRKELDFSISLNAAKHPFALMWLAVGAGMSLLFGGFWYFGWFVDQYDAPWYSTMLFTSILTSLLLAVVVPDIAGMRRKVHRFAGYVTVIFMPLFLLSVALQMPSRVRLIAAVVVVAQIVMIYLLFFVKKALKYLLPFQAVYLLGFFLVLLILSYA